MKSGTEVRALSQTGQLTLPASVRRELSIAAGGELEIFAGEDQRGPYVVLQRYEAGCRFCGAHEAKPIGPKSVLVCDSCAKAAADKLERGDRVG